MLARRLVRALDDLDHWTGNMGNRQNVDADVLCQLEAGP